MRLSDMRLSTRQRILIALNEQSESLSKAWDVPRDASLPGLSERLGVVRSALHSPLKELLDTKLVDSRQAHVIGGGNRKRTVLHPTDAGRVEAERVLSEFDSGADGADGSEAVDVSSRVGGRLYGAAPSLVELHGRDELLAELLSGVDGRARQVVTGLPGIGKTALVRAVADASIEAGWNVRWSTMDIDGDISSISGDWFDSDSLSTLDALTARIDSIPARTLLIIDEIQSVHRRHADSVGALCEMLLRSTRPCILATRAPAPFDPKSTGSKEYRLDGLANESGALILGETLPEKEAKMVSDALGGHPLALHLWTPEDEVPAAATAVQDFVRETVLAKLEDDANLALDEFVLSPLPLTVDEIDCQDGVGLLDDAALLRWETVLAEVQHLIRNVRLTSWPEDEREIVHSRLADWWSEKQGSRARRIEAHHVLNAGGGSEMSEKLVDLLPKVAVENSAAAASLLEDSISALPTAMELRALAVDIALERGEPIHAERHLEVMPIDSAKEARLARLERLRGNDSAASAHEAKAVAEATPSERVKLEIGAIARTIDDRLPGEVAVELNRKIERQIERCDISPLSSEEASVAEIALIIAKIRIALDSGEVERAIAALKILSARAAPGDEMVRRLRLRCDIAIADADDSVAFLTARIDAEPDVRGRTGAVHALLEVIGPEPAAVACFERHTHAALRDDVAADRRLLAQRWYWRGMINEEERMSAWHEASERFRRAECPTAANSLQARLHKLF